MDRGMVQQAGAARLAAQHQVLGHRQVGQHGQFLEHRGDAGRPRGGRAAQLQPLPGHADLARIRLVHAGQQLHQGGLAGTVLAGDGMDGAGPAAQAHVLQRGGGAEALADTLHHDQIGPGIGSRRVGEGVGHRAGRLQHQRLNSSFSLASGRVLGTQ
jgi:hypothetical protein